MTAPTYIVFPHLRGVEYNANAGAYVMGIAQPTAIGGLVHAFSRIATQEYGVSMHRLPAFAYSVSHFAGFSGRSLNQRQGFGTLKVKGDAARPAPVTDRPRATFDFSLIIEIVIDEPGVVLSPDVMKDIMLYQRIQAGGIFCEEAPSIVEDLAQALALLPATGFVLCDATRDMEELLDAGQDTVTAMATLFSRPSLNSYKPRHVPLVTGWEALQEPAVRPGMKSSAYAHAYAEPVLSAGLFRSVASARQLFLDNSDDDTLLWVHKSDGNLHTICGTAPFYNEVTEY